jgi:hypothetical protein
MTYKGRPAARRMILAGRESACVQQASRRKTLIHRPPQGRSGTVPSHRRHHLRTPTPRIHLRLQLLILATELTVLSASPFLQPATLCRRCALYTTVTALTTTVVNALPATK